MILFMLFFVFVFSTLVTVVVNHKDGRLVANNHLHLHLHPITSTLEAKTYNHFSSGSHASFLLVVYKRIGGKDRVCFSSFFFESKEMERTCLERIDDPKPTQNTIHSMSFIPFDHLDPFCHFVFIFERRFCGSTFVWNGIRNQFAKQQQ